MNLALSNANHTVKHLCQWQTRARSRNANANANRSSSLIWQRFHHVAIGNSNKNEEERTTCKMTYTLRRSINTCVTARRTNFGSIYPTYNYQMKSLNDSTNAAFLGLSSVRYFSTINDNDNNKNDGDSKAKINKEKIQKAAAKGSKAVKKGAYSIREIFKKHGWTFIGTYLSLYAITLSSLFAGLDSGLIDPTTLLSNFHIPWHSSGLEDAASSSPSTDKEDAASAVEYVASYMRKFSWTAPHADVIIQNPHMTNLALAWVATKLTEPIRLGVSLAIVRQIGKKKNDDAKEEGSV